MNSRARPISTTTAPGLTHCFSWWEGQSVDIDGYTTRESAADDLEDLRRALGVPRLNLWGISYGSHLALAYLKYHPARTERAALAGIEGLDQTVKLPAETDALFARVQKLIDADSKAKAIYPDLAGLMRRVHAKLDAKPAEVTFTPQGAPAPVTIRFDGFVVQMAVGGLISDPPRIAGVPLLYLALDNGAYEPFARILHQFFLSGPAGFAGMPEAMDLASGIDRERLALVERQAGTGLLGDTLNFPMPQIAGIRPSLDLGRAFRAPFQSPAPVLFISGTLDGRTSVPEAKATLRQFPRGRHLIVKNGGHNIFEADPRIADAVVAYFNGAPVPQETRFDPPAIKTP
ncbi:MAG: alpha/beta fold hydrolase [Alphaproteobacteria bacterium]